MAVWFGTKRPWGKPPMTSSGGNLIGGFLKLKGLSSPVESFQRRTGGSPGRVRPIEFAARRGIPPALHGNCYPNRRFGQLLNFGSPGHCKLMLPGFCFSCRFSAFSGLQPPGLLRVAKAPFCGNKRSLPSVSGNFRFIPCPYFAGLNLSGKNSPRRQRTFY